MSGLMPMGPPVGEDAVGGGLTPSRGPHTSPFGRAVDAMHAVAENPNGQVRGSVDGWYDVRVDIDPGYAERVGDREMQVQLQRLARLLFAARTREYYRLYALHLEPDPFALTRTRSRFEATLEDDVVQGSGGGGAVEVTSVGMREWTVRVRPGAVAALGSRGLADAATEAAAQVVTSWLQVIAAYKRGRWGRS